MDPNNNEIVELLRGMWNDMKAQGQTLNAKIDKTNERMEALGQSLGAKIDQTNERIDGVCERLDTVEGRLDSIEVRLGKVEGSLREQTAQHRWLSSFVANHVEQDLSRIKERLDKIETHQEGH